MPDLRLRGQLSTSIPFAYAVFDQDHSAASTALLARLDGSGIFQRQADLCRAEDIATWIDSGRALLVIQIDQDFERHLLAGETAPVEVIADGRNSNTAGTALGYLNQRGRRLQRRLAIQPRSGRSQRSDRDPLMVQPKPRFALEHDPEPDRHADDDGHA